MERLATNIAVNLRRIRKMKNMSLDHAAIRTGVSKSMLAQIERGEANPTIGILEKIVDGLRVSFDDLIARQEAKGYAIERCKMTPVREAAGQYRVYSCLPYEDGRNFELYVVEIESGCCYCSELYDDRAYEYIEVTDGNLELSIENRVFYVKKGDFFCFDAGKEHSYRNRGEERLSMTIFITLHFRM